MQVYIAIIFVGAVLLQVSCQSLNAEDFQPDFDFNGRQQQVQRNVRQQGDFDDNPFLGGDQRQFGRPPSRRTTTTTTTTTPPSPGGDDSSTTTTASPRFNACVNSCQTTQQYNPVCGSDGVTYNNEFRLRCASNCGKSVQLVRGGTCTAL